MTDSPLASAVRAAAHQSAPPPEASPSPAFAAAPPPLTAKDLAAAHADGLAAGRSEGVTAERARIAGILDHENAKGRETLARYFAFKTDMGVEAAVAALAAAPAEAPKTAADTGLLAEMAAIKHPSVGPDGGAKAENLTDYEKGALEAKRLLGL